MGKHTRIDRIISDFLRSEFYSNWQAKHIQEGGLYPEGDDRRDRFDRCYEAAKTGSDGSTHAEHIADMRSAFGDWLRDRRRSSRLKCAEFPYRLEAAADEYFDRLEAWHHRAGTLDQEVG